VASSSDLPILALLREKRSGIQVHSSQNNNIMLFSVVHSASDGETNLLTYKDLYKICRFPQAGLWKSSWAPGQVVGQQFQTKNG
jgi:hypothetical protein